MNTSIVRKVLCRKSKDLTTTKCIKATTQWLFIPFFLSCEKRAQNEWKLNGLISMISEGLLTNTYM